MAKVSVKRKKAVIQRANNCCEYCRSQARFATQPFSVEHIIPVSKSGKNTLENLALACQGCNNYKYNKTEALDVVSAKLAPLFHPRQHIWHHHFGWDEDFSLIIGLTATGRATVEALKLNRKTLINLRQILYKADEHPPRIS